MKIFLILFLIAFNHAYALSITTFSDDFDHGNLSGWTIKSGDWSNLGDQLISSNHNYGIIRKNDSFGYNQSIQVDAYFDSGLPYSKTAQLFLRNGKATWGPNPFWDHGYFANVLDNNATIFNAVWPYNQQVIGQTDGLLCHSIFLERFDYSSHSIQLHRASTGAGFRLPAFSRVPFGTWVLMR